MDSNIFAHSAELLTPADKGPLADTAVSVPANISVRGWPVEAGSLALEGFTALEDATVVARLRAAGAALPGSTRTAPLGFGLEGDTAARAVSDGLVRAALSVDTMGEPRWAAACAGLVGFKPSWGVVSRLGVIGLIPSMECCGVITADVGQAARAMGVVAGPDPADFSMPALETPDFGASVKGTVEGAVIGIVKEALEGMDRETAAAFRAALDRVEAAGVRTREVSLPDLPLARAVHQVVGSVEASSATGKYDSVRYGHRAASGRNWNEMYLDSRGESFGMPLKAYILQGAWFQYRKYPAFVDAARVRGRLLERSEGLLGEVNALALPTRPRASAAERKTVGGVYDLFAWTVPASLTGQPAVTLPGFAVADGFDQGLQLIGRFLGDAGLLSLALGLRDAQGGGEA